MKIQRLFGVTIAAVMTSLFMLSTLTGCKSDIKANGIYDEEITVGEWIRIVNQKFGFTEYFTDTPYFEHIDSNHTYYDEVQAAVNAGVIPESYEDLDTEKLLTREFTAVTLAGAYYYTNTNDVYIEDLDECTYQDQIKTVINDGIMFLNDDSEFCPDEKVLYVEAAEYLQMAHNYWSCYTFDETVYEYTVKDNVIDLTGFTTISETEDNEFVMDEEKVAENKKLMDQNHLQYDETTGRITLDNLSQFSIAEGTVVMLPEGYGTDKTEILKVTGIEEEADGTYIVETEQGIILDAYDNFNYQESTVPNFAECEFYDANGNLVEMQTKQANPTQVAFYENEGEVVPLGFSRMEKIMPLDWEYNESFNLGDVYKEETFNMEGFEVKVGLYKDKIAMDLDYSQSSDDASLNTNFHVELSDLLFTIQYKVNEWCGLPSGLESAMVRLDYDNSQSLTISGDYEKEYYIGRCVCPIAGDLSVDVDISLKVALNGEISIGVDVMDSTVGFEYRNGNLTDISHKGTVGKPQMEINASARVTCPLKLGLSVFGGNVGVYATPEIGIGGDVHAENNTVEFPEQEPYEIMCADVELYMIAKISCLIEVKPIKWEKSKSFTLLEKGSGTFKTYHLEDWEEVSECTAERAEMEKNAAEHNVEIGGDLLFENSNITICVGESCEVKLKEIPDGYTFTEDIYANYSNDENAIMLANPDNILNIGETISSVYFLAGLSQFLFIDTKSSMKFIGYAPGTATITYKTKDTQHTATCTITVTETNEDENSSTGTIGTSSLQLASSYISVSPGSSEKLEVISLPSGISDSDLIWTSEDPSIATVDANGNVTGVADGVTTITVTTSDGAHAFKCTVSVFAGAGENAAYHEDDVLIVSLQKV